MTWLSMQWGAGHVTGRLHSGQEQRTERITRLGGHTPTQSGYVKETRDSMGVVQSATSIRFHPMDKDLSEAVTSAAQAAG